MLIFRGRWISAANAATCAALCALIVVLSFAGAASSSPPVPVDLPAFGGHQPSMAVAKPTGDWASVISRFRQQEDETFAGFALEAISFWERGVALAVGGRSIETLGAVHRHFRQIPYVSDRTNYHVADRWATPLEFITDGGDCEEYATAEFLALVRGGWPQEHVYVVNGILPDDVIHTIVIVSIEEGGRHGWWVLDSRHERPEPLEMDDLLPVTAMNQQSTWLYNDHRLQDGSPPGDTGDYGRQPASVPAGAGRSSR